MPYQTMPNQQLTTYAKAKEAVAKLSALGVPMGKLWEVDIADRCDTTSTDPKYYDDGGLHQYVAQLWSGPEQNISMVLASLASGNFDFGSFIRIAEMAGMNFGQAQEAVMGLNGVRDSVNTVLQSAMK